MENITVEDGNSTYYSDGNCIIEKSTRSLILGCAKSIIPNNVRNIEDYAFSGSKNLIKIIIPNTVKNIGRYAFLGCKTLTNISIPNSVAQIGPGAFEGCSSLTNITIPNTVKEISHNMFKGCASLTDFIIPGSVLRIGFEAFCGCTSLKYIKIPNSVTYIESGSFADCSNLEDIMVEDENRVYYSEGNSVIEKSTNTLILGCAKTNISNTVTSIGFGAFSGCNRLTSIKIPSSVTRIESSSFSGCSNLENIMVEDENSIYYSEGNCIIERSTNTLILGCAKTIIPQTVTNIGNYAFSGNENLTNINIPNSVSDIGDYAFGGCKNLLSINIPSSVVNTGQDLFMDCVSLEEITLPSSLTRLKSRMFNGCENLRRIISNATIPPSCEQRTFDGFDTSKCELLVPQESVSDYKAYYGWHKFKSVGNTEANIDKMNENPLLKKADVFKLDGTRIRRNADVRSLKKGIYIINGKKVLVK